MPNSTSRFRHFEVPLKSHPGKPPRKVSVVFPRVTFESLKTAFRENRAHIGCVCELNRGRSQVLMFLLRKALSERGLGNIAVHSAGVKAKVGDPLGPMPALLARAGILREEEVRYARTAPVTPEFVRASNIIFVMDHK